MSEQVGYRLVFPEYLSGYESETEAKGFLTEVKVVTAHETYEFVVYDAVRLSQDAVSDTAQGGCLVLGSTLVVPAVTRDEISRAVHQLSRSNFAELMPSRDQS